MNNQTNNTNPYKKYGDLHNKGLDSIIKKLSRKTSKGLTLEQIITTVCEYLKVINAQKSATEDAINYSLIADTLNKSSKTNLVKRLRKVDLSQAAINLIKKLLAINTDKVEDILERIKQIEEKTFDLELNAREKNYVLLSLAIAEASVNYWGNEQKKANSFWKKFSQKIKKIPWKADVEGALLASVDPITDVIYTVTPAGPVIIVTKIVGSAVVASAVRYIMEAKKIDEEEESARIVKERQVFLREKAKNIPRLKPPDSKA